VYRFRDNLTAIYENRHWISRASPAVSAAGIAVILAVLVVVANHRRIINKVWALALIILALWQASVAGVQLLGSPIFVRFAIFFAGCAVALMALLKEVIVTPRRSLSGHLWRIRYYLASIPLYCLIFIAHFSSIQSYGSNTIYWILSILCIGSGCLMVIRAVSLIWTRKVVGFCGLELKAFAGLAGGCFATALVSTILGRITGVRYIRWFAPSILIIGLLFFTSFVARNEIIDTHDIKEKLLLWGARGVGCLFVGLFFISSVALFGVMSLQWRVAYCAVLTIMLIALPIIDRQLRVLLDKHFVSPGFYLAQSAVNVETEGKVFYVDLHAGYTAVLRKWANGSSDVFLSEGVFSTSWPTTPLPDSLLQCIFEQHWITSEILEQRGAVGDESERHVLGNQIGAAVGYVSPQGEKLLALFRIRDSGKPFVSRELREAFELLRQMQVGLAFARMRQTQRSDDRLNFYGHYAPQFAHELRNGLYLQAQLLRAIANGHCETVLPSDAEVGLEKIEQLDRLCGHFFSVGAVFKQPVRVLSLCETLKGIVEKANDLIGKALEAEIELQIDVLNEGRIVANPDMLGIALQNLLQNSAEALANVPLPRRIKVTAVVQFEKVRILVRDNGPGMPADKCLDTFSPGLSHKKGGMGLGLSIVRDCIEAMGGTIGLRPPDGPGACFEITLKCPSLDRCDNPVPNVVPKGSQLRPKFAETS
jgi:signal transduction histidine kinase